MGVRGRSGRKGLRRRARVRVRPPPGSPVSRGKTLQARSTRLSPALPGAVGLSPARPFRSGRPRDLLRAPRVRKRSEGRGVGNAEPGASLGPGGSSQRRARGRCLLRAPTRAVRGHACPPSGSASHLSLHSRPRGRLWGSPGRDPRPCALTPGLPGVETGPSLLAPGKTLGSERLQKQVADEASGGGGVWTHLSGIETRALLLSRCKGS